MPLFNCFNSEFGLKNTRNITVLCDILNHLGIDHQYHGQMDGQMIAIACVE